MTELEQLLLNNLERMENELQSRMESHETALAGIEARLHELERHVPQLGTLCEELQRLLQRLSGGSRV